MRGIFYNSRNPRNCGQERGVPPSRSAAAEEDEVSSLAVHFFMFLFYTFIFFSFLFIFPFFIFTFSFFSFFSSFFFIFSVFFLYSPRSPPSPLSSPKNIAFFLQNPSFHESFDIVLGAAPSGLEALRRLVRRWEPLSGEAQSSSATNLSSRAVQIARPSRST